MSDSPRRGGTVAALRGAPGPRTGVPDPAFWRSRRVFLTGHTGFKGSWLSLWLHALGAEVTGYALEPPTRPGLFEQAQVGTAVRSVIADIRDQSRLAAAMGDARPEVVFHLAAQSVVRRGYADPVETYSSNVMGTVHVLESVRRLGTGCAVVNVTSDKCYAHGASGRAHREDDPMGGDDPYSSSKGCAELVTHAYSRSFFAAAAPGAEEVALASARAGNAVGGGDWTPDQLVPDLVRAFAAHRPCLIRSPAGIRPWQFVLEPLRGYLLLAEGLAARRPGLATGWNFGPVDADAKPVSWIADRVASAWGSGACWERDAAEHPPEAAVLTLDASMAAAAIGWRPALSLDMALDWSVEWYRAWDRGENLPGLTRAQIERYERTVAS